MTTPTILTCMSVGTLYHIDVNTGVIFFTVRPQTPGRSMFIVPAGNPNGIKTGSC